MIVIPAIDLINNKCVRLRQGRYSDETVFSDDPVSVANNWCKKGATRLHIVDLDGAATGQIKHAHIVREIAQQNPQLTIQVGGGIRNDDSVQEYLDMGIEYVILGTRAVSQPHLVKDLCLEFPGRIIVGLDVKDGKIASAGWSKLSHHSLLDLAQHFEEDGVAAIAFTDINSDGMLSGFNTDTPKQLAKTLKIPIIVAGGIRDLTDIEKVCRLEKYGVMGVIAGRSLYEETLDLSVAQDLADKLCPPS